MDFLASSMLHTEWADEMLRAYTYEMNCIANCVYQIEEVQVLHLKVL